jgi:hypothetical protein
MNHWQSIDSSLIEQHFCMSDIKRIPMGSNGRRIDFDVGVEIDDERGEGLGKSVDEGSIVERRG